MGKKEGRTKDKKEEGGKTDMTRGEERREGGRKKEREGRKNERIKEGIRKRG